jgi:hypothetical protein
MKVGWAGEWGVNWGSSIVSRALKKRARAEESMAIIAMRGVEIRFSATL